MLKTNRQFQFIERTSRLANARSRRCAIVALCFLGLGVAQVFGASPAVTETPHHIFHWRPFLAPFHAVVLHFPIGFITMAFILELYQLRQPSKELERITRLTIWLSLFAGLVAASLGLVRAAGGGYDTQLVERHRLTGLWVPIFTVATLVAQKYAHRHTTKGFRYAYRALLVATVALLVVASHFGGNLTHGSRYLVENAPDFVRELLEPDPSSADNPSDPITGSTPETALDPSARFFLEKVRPILVAKCVTCHGPEKHKGDYRLDQGEFALKGGKSEKAAIVPGQPLASPLIERILAKPGSDDVMPPDGKEPLTPDEVMILIEWIRDGASFGNPTAAAAAGGSEPSPRH